MLQIWLPLNGNLNNQGLNSTNGTWVGTSSYDNNGKIGKCVSCNSSHYVICPYNFLPTNKFSQTFWIYIPSTLGNCGLWEYVLQIDGYNINWASYNQLKIYDNGNNLLWWLSSDIFYDKWVHLAIVHTGDTIYLYINGLLYGKSNSSSTAISSGTIYLGSGIDTTNGPIKFNDYRLYDSVLSPKEVHEIAKGLVLHYPMNTLEGSNNLITGLKAGGQTTISNNQIFIKGNSSDTYFRIQTSKSMISGKSYRISCLGEGFSSSSFYYFSIAGLNNSSIGSLKVKNGYCELYFVANNTCANSGTLIILDDINRNAGAGIIKNLELIELDTIYDCSGYCNNGTVTGSLQVVDDSPRYKKSIKIINSTISHPLCLSNNNLEWTCCAWIKPTSQSNTLYLNNFNHGNIIYYYGGYPLLYLNSGSNDYYNYGNLKPNANEWTHIAFVFKNSTGYRHIFINGEDATNTMGPNETSTPSGLPSTITLFSGFNGQVSDYREYSTALSEDDIKELYNTSVWVANNGTIAAYELNEE